MLQTRPPSGGPLAEAVMLGSVPLSGRPARTPSQRARAAGTLSRRVEL
jgi:hypothetical protein